MKKFILTTMTATLMAGCSTDEENECTSPPNEYPVEIMASTGVSGIQTRGPINTDQSVTAGFIASASGGDHSTNLWTVAGTFTASTTASTTFSPTPAQYYPADGSIVHIKGYYPQGTLSDNTVTSSETDGSNDVMISGEASGNKIAGGALAFTFNHLLIQLQFTFKAGTGFPVTGKTVASIAFKNQQTPTSLNINGGTAPCNPAGIGITFTGSYAISADPGTTTTIYPMVKGSATNMVIDIVAGGVTYLNVAVNLNTETGEAHNIIPTSAPKGIIVPTIVTPWATGGTGASVVQQLIL